jgi:hypothetical protein
VEAEETSIPRQRLSKSSAVDMQATINEVLGTLFSVRSVQSGNKRNELVNLCSVGSQTVKSRFYVCSSTVIFGVRNSVKLL